MIREGFSADYSVRSGSSSDLITRMFLISIWFLQRELLQYEQEKQLLGQSGVTVSAIDLSQIVRRPVNIDTSEDFDVCSTP